MKRLFETLIAVLWVFVPLQIAHGQQAEAPVYEDGDWWRVRVEFEHKGFSRSGGICSENFSEYLVEMEQGNPKVFGISGNNKEAINCEIISRHLFNIPDDRGHLKFPLTVGSRWSQQWTNKEGRYRTWNLNVAAWEKVQTPKGEFDAFKIEADLGGFPINLVYYYSPKVKANVLFKLTMWREDRTMTLVDFKVRK